MTDFTLEELAARQDTITNNMITFTQQLRDWMAGTVLGGYNSDGTVSDGVAPHGGYWPLSNGLVTYYVQSPAKMVHDTMKGDKGDNASQDFAIDVVGTFGPSEYMGGFIAPIAATYNPSGSYATAGVAPTSSFVVTIKKNGAAWGTITYSAGSTTGTVAISSPTVVAGDIIDYYGPATPDATFTHFKHTLRGS